MNRGLGVGVQLALHQPEHAPLATSRGVHAGRPTLLFGLELTLAGERSEVWAEACPLPGFGPVADHIDLARAELMALDAGQVSLWLSAPPLAGLAACFEATAALGSAAARHALEWAVIEALARLAGTGPAELLHAWLERSSGAGSWPGPRQVLATSAVLDLLDPDLSAAARRLAERGILTWKLKCGRHPALEQSALEDLARLDLPARLRLDPGTCWTPAEAVDFVREVVALCQRSRLTLEYVEDPTPDPADWAELASLAPLAADEVLETSLSLQAAMSPTSFWILKPMVYGIGRVLELSAQGAAAGQHVVISHTFDGPLALRASTELACVVQTHDHAAGLGPHLALEPWSRPGTSGGTLLRGERLGPAHLDHGVLLDGGHVARVLSAGRADPARPTEPPRDALSIARAAALYPGRTFLCLDDRTVTFAELGASLARADRGGGAATSDFVPIVAETTPEAILSLLAALERGVPVLLLHPSSTDETRARTIEHCQGHAAELAPGDAVVVPTSGSTAAPRLVVHTRASLLSAVSASAARLGAPSPDTRWLLSLPFAHVGGLSILLRCLAAGACVVSSPLPKTPREVERLLAQARVTHLSIVPTQLGRWLSAADFRFPPCVECVLVGGAHASASLRQSALDRGAPVLFSYGLTEMGSQVATEAPRQPRRDGWLSAVGRPLPGVELAVSADGCLSVGGPMLMRAYLGQPTPSQVGLLRTSDVGRLDDDGRLTVLGRMDDMIVSGGENVAPSAVEAALADVSGVLEICVLGRPSPEWGQEVVALVVLQRGLEPATLEQALRVAARAGLPGFAQPKAYRFLDELPRLASGKVDRRRLGLELLALSTR